VAGDATVAGAVTGAGDVTVAGAANAAMVLVATQMTCAAVIAAVANGAVSALSLIHSVP
jgi:hypothetical protein